MIKRSLSKVTLIKESLKRTEYKLEDRLFLELISAYNNKGFARNVAHKITNLTEYVATRWYRAP